MRYQALSEQAAASRAVLDAWGPLSRYTRSIFLIDLKVKVILGRGKGIYYNL